jgi:hypothetical protein
VRDARGRQLPPSVLALQTMSARTYDVIDSTVSAAQTWNRAQA